MEAKTVLKRGHRKTGNEMIGDDEIKRRLETHFGNIKEYNILIKIVLQGENTVQRGAICSDASEMITFKRWTNRSVRVCKQ